MSNITALCKGKIYTFVKNQITVKKKLIVNQMIEIRQSNFPT